MNTHRKYAPINENYQFYFHPSDDHNRGSSKSGDDSESDEDCDCSQA